MDCPGKLGLALCLLAGMAGCQHQVTTLGGAGQTTASIPPPRPDQIKKVTAKKDPPPEVLVSWGDFKTGESQAPDIPPARQQQMREDARQDYQRALKADPKFVPAYVGLARLYSAMEDPNRAVESYRKALQITPNDARVWYEMGMCFNYQKNWGPAVECLSRAAQLDPANRDYGNALGVVLAQAGRYHESLACFVRSSGEAMGHYRLAQTLHRLQQPELSRRYLAVALQKDPSLATSMAPPGEGGPPSGPQLQRTAYQAPSPPQPSPAPVARPRVIDLDASAANPAPAPAPQRPTPPATYVPSPPVHLNYGAPATGTVTMP